LVLKDKRDERAYHIAKLADGNCWMLSNLQLGSESEGMPLTGEDTNIASDWTLPQLVTTSSLDYDVPHVYGPVPGDTGSGATNYGYLYNWCAATAGGTASGGSDTCTTGSTQPSAATGDICPVNWRMPRGGGLYGANNEFDQLSAKMAGYPSNQDSDYRDDFDYSSTFSDNFIFSGPFRGVFSGTWDGGLGAQGGYGVWWSGSVSPSGSPGYAFRFYVYASGFVSPHSIDHRYRGFAVRCLLQ
jgi:uncharacterized protein (TIGR02145 family)